MESGPGQLEPQTVSSIIRILLKINEFWAWPAKAPEGPFFNKNLIKNYIKESGSCQLDSQNGHVPIRIYLKLNGIWAWQADLWLQRMILLNGIYIPILIAGVLCTFPHI